MTFPSLLFAARRWGFSSRRKVSANRVLTASMGIAIGVTALIVVLGVMGGLQEGYIASILEINSFHLRAEVVPEKAEEAGRKIAELDGIASVIAFQEIHVLAMGPSGKTMTLGLRALESGTDRRDVPMVKALGLPAQDEFPNEEGIVLGREAAFLLGVEAGSQLRIFGVRQTEDEGVVPVEATVVVKDLFHSGYYEFDSSLGFVAISETEPWAAFFKGKTLTLGIKLQDRFADQRGRRNIDELAIADISPVVSWREFNRSFFGALRTEKTVMMLLIGLIFIVVGINIFHAMRRTIATKKSEIAVLKACGASDLDVRTVFMLEGLAIGILGTLAGLALGILVARNINPIIQAFSSTARSAASVMEALGVMKRGGDYRLFSPAYFYLESIPVLISPTELVFIALAAIASPTFSALIASRKVSEASPAEVFRNE